jgi:glycosyltransferase involved in cell wall biosynthesis
MGDGALGEAMKIVFLDTGAYEYAIGSSKAVGGTERDIWLLSRALAVAGWSVAVGVQGPLKLGQRRVIEGVEYVGISGGNPLIAWYRFLSLERPDWLFWEGASHWWGPLVEIAKLRGIRTVFHAAFDTDMQPRQVQPRQALFRRRRWWPLFAWGLLRTDRIFVQHSGQLLLLPPQWRSKAQKLPKVCSLPSGVKAQSERAEYVAWVAMLRIPKRPDLLIEIARKAPTIRFVVCGGLTSHRTPGDYGNRVLDALEKLPNVDYRGRVHAEDASRVIADAAVLLCTSDQEGFPNTFVQAWSHGTPVVSLHVDPDSVVKRLHLGAVTGTVEATVDELKRLLKSPQEREAIAKSAREYILNHNSSEVVVKAFEEGMRL